MSFPFKNIATSKRNLAVAAVSLFAGAGDSSSGLLLVAVPIIALKLMGAPKVSDPTLIRFVGVFVACVGASYFLGLYSWVRNGSLTRLKTVWELTILFRIAAGSFVAWQMITGNFSLAWISVPLTDFTWALIQTALLRLGIFESEI